MLLKNIKLIIIIYVKNIYVYKKVKTFKFINIIYYNRFQFYKNVNNKFYKLYRRFIIIKK